MPTDPPDPPDEPQRVAHQVHQDDTERLRQLGVRVTPQRLFVLEALEQASGHMTAEAIMQRRLRAAPLAPPQCLRPQPSRRAHRWPRVGWL